MGLPKGNTSISARALLSVIVPAFNEQDVLPQTHARLTAVGKQLLAEGMSYELIFINDGSRDGTAETLTALSKSRSSRSRRSSHAQFRASGGCLGGAERCAGRCCRDYRLRFAGSSRVAAALSGKWREGFQVIFAIRQKRKEWFGKRFAYWTFYRLLAAISDLPIPLDSGDFCLMDRRASICSTASQSNSVSCAAYGHGSA